MSHLSKLIVAAALLMSPGTAVAQSAGAQQRPQLLVVIDGVVLSDGLELNRLGLAAADIDRIEVIKRSDVAVAAYGERARHGVIVVTTRYARAGRPVSEQQLQWLRKAADLSASGEIAPGQPLVIVDGVTIGRLPFRDLGLAADEIASIEILKGAAALSKYGELATGGVMSITTKD